MRLLEYFFLFMFNWSIFWSQSGWVAKAKLIELWQQLFLTTTNTYV